jgi:hypothetical protein
LLAIVLLSVVVKEIPLLLFVPDVLIVLFTIVLLLAPVKLMPVLPLAVMFLLTMKQFRIVTFVLLDATIPEPEAFSAYVIVNPAQSKSTSFAPMVMQVPLPVILFVSVSLADTVPHEATAEGENSVVSNCGDTGGCSVGATAGVSVGLIVG